MEFNVIEVVSGFVAQWAPIVLQVVGAAALIATLTRNKSDDRIIQIILDIVNFVAANFGRAKNDPTN